MKILITAFVLFLVTNTFSQSTAYHSDIKLGKKPILNEWYNSEVKHDVLIFEPSTVSYAKSYRQLKKALDFYALDFDKPIKDESVISSLCKSIEDFEMMNLTIKTESSEIFMVWKSDLVTIFWSCTTERYAISIKEL